MTTTKHPLRLQVGPFTLVNVMADRATYHRHRWALPGGASLSTVEIHGLATANGWSAPALVDHAPISHAKVSARVGVPDSEVGRINRGPTHREVWPGVVK